MTDTVTISLGAMPSGFSLTGNGHFHGSRLGLDYDYAITCKNVAGTVGLCGPTTDQASVDVSWSGDLDTANVAYQMIKVLADALPVGPILIGPARPVHILTKSVTARGILNMTAVAAVEAQERTGRQQPTLFG